MEDYKIYPLHVSTFLMNVTAGKNFPEVPPKVVKSPVLAYLIKAPDTAILVDTGASEADWSEKHHYKLEYPEEMRIENRLRALGVEPDDIKTVVNTHLHWDHCYNNHLFKNAEIYVQRKEIESAVCPPVPTQYVYYEALQIGLVPPWIKTAGQFRVIDGDYELKEGIKLVLLPGHTPGFQGVLVETKAGRYLIAGDCVPNMDLWNERVFGYPTASHITANDSEYYATLKKMTTMADYVLPGHDFSALEKSCYP